MTIILAAVTLLSLLLALLVAGLLRSHAEILRRLEPLEQSRGRTRDPGMTMDPSLAPVAKDSAATQATHLEGTTIRGEPLRVDMSPGCQSTLLAFLTSGCVTCETFWQAFRGPRNDLATGARLVIVTKDTQLESPSRLRKLAPSDGTPVVMCSGAWEAYDVPVAPYFVYVDGPSGKIRGEGAASAWEQLQRLFEDFVADTEAEVHLARGEHLPTGRRLSDSHPDRIREADATLLAAGIGPDHPSLWPNGKPSTQDLRR